MTHEVCFCLSLQPSPASSETHQTVAMDQGAPPTPVFEDSDIPSRAQAKAVLELPVQQQVRPAPGRNAVITRLQHAPWHFRAASIRTRIPAHGQRLELLGGGWPCAGFHCTSVCPAALPRGPSARSAPCIGSKPLAPSESALQLQLGPCAGPDDAIACPQKRVMPLSSALHPALLRDTL